MAVVSIIIIFGYLLLYEINRRWFKNISFLAHLMLSIIFVNSTGIILATRAMDLVSCSDYGSYDVPYNDNVFLDKGIA